MEPITEEDHAAITAALKFVDDQMREGMDEEDLAVLALYEKGMDDGQARAKAGGPLGELPEHPFERRGIRDGWLDERNDPTDVLVYREADVWWAYRDVDQCLVGFSSWAGLIARYPDATDMEEDFSDMLKDEQEYYAKLPRLFVVS